MIFIFIPVSWGLLMYSGEVVVNQKSVLDSTYTVPVKSLDT